MIKLSRKILTINWLQNKLIKHENGIVFDDANFSCFEVIQEFVETNTCRFKTPIIYYQAFPEESAAEFIETLRAEITAKLGTAEGYLDQPLEKIVADTGLKMVIIDRSHLHPQDTLNSLLEQLANCNVRLILVGSYKKMKVARILNHPLISLWDRFAINGQCECECLTQVFSRNYY